MIAMMVVFQRDLGTALVLFAILLGMLWVVGVPARLFGVALSIVGVVAFYLAASNAERRTRLTSFIDQFKDFQGAGWQAGHGLLGMSSGGIFGKGLSASQQKWGSLPEAHTNFIFAVLGEELGLIGTLLVLALFGASCGGGTAGHTSPLLATAVRAAASRAGHRDHRARHLPRAGRCGRSRRPGTPSRPPVPLPAARTPPRTPGRVRAARSNAALEVIDRLQPDVVVGFGGYVSVPAYLAARKRRLPLVVHEGNALPGIAEQLGARFTTQQRNASPTPRGTARRATSACRSAG